MRSCIESSLFDIIVDITKSTIKMYILKNEGGGGEDILEIS